MMRTPGLVFANAAASRRFVVSFVLGRWIVMKSLWASSVSRSTNSTPMCRARSSEMNGSKAIRRMPKADARWATSAPILPSPTTPRVLPCSSTPSHLLRSHLPAFNAEWAWGMLRAWANKSAIVCSAAERMLETGALTTITPSSVALATSTLSRPMPARPTTTRSFAASSVGPSTLVAERMISAWAPARASINCGRRETQSDVHLVPGVAQFLKTGVGNLFGYQYTSHQVTFR
jgi:hypothetical protein